MAYPDSIDKDLVGTYPASTKSGGGYFYDSILEYRVWCRPWEGAPDEFDGETYYYAFHSFQEAKEFSDATKGSEEPLVLVKQMEWINEPESGRFIHEVGERLTEWRVDWLERDPRTNSSIPEFLAANGNVTRQ